MPDEIWSRLQQWPRGLALDQRTLVRRTLRACRSIFQSPRAVLVWEEREEPWLIIASLSDEGFIWNDEEPERYLPLVDPALTDVSFYTKGTSVRVGAENAPAVTIPIHEQLRNAFQMSDVLSAPVRGEAVQGRLFVIAPAELNEQALPAVEMVGLLVERAMDYVAFIKSNSRQAVQEERIRVARDLHDGLLQSFTGVVLQLETIHRLIDTEPEKARRMITDIEGVIMADQRELRVYVEQLRPRRRIDVPFDFNARMEELRSRFETQWGIGVSFEIGSVDPLVAKSLGPETFRIIQEAVTNSAKHGAASHVRVRLSSGENKMRIEVMDDGHGFPFHGRMTLAAIRESGVGPAMLAERVAALNGDLAVESSGTGARLEISVPLGFAGAS
jgi:signal transduction histidine kinase